MPKVFQSVGWAVLLSGLVSKLIQVSGRIHSFVAIKMRPVTSSFRLEAPQVLSTGPTLLVVYNGLFFLLCGQQENSSYSSVPRQSYTRACGHRCDIPSPFPYSLRIKS